MVRSSKKRKVSAGADASSSSPVPVSADEWVEALGFKPEYLPGKHRKRTQGAVRLISERHDLFAAYASDQNGAHARARFNRSAAQRVYMSKDDLKSKGMSPDDAMKDLDAWLRDGPYVDGALKRGYLIKDDLVNIMRWKVSFSKWRPLLKGLIEKNTADAVKAATKKAIASMNGIQDKPSERDERILAAVATLCSMKNVGPITATAILFPLYPTHIAYGCDEALEALGFDRSKMRKPKDILDYVNRAKRVADAYKVLPRDVSDAIWRAAWDDDLDGS